MEITPNLQLPGDAKLKVTRMLVFYYLLKSETMVVHSSGVLTIAWMVGWVVVPGRVRHSATT